MRTIVQVEFRPSILSIRHEIPQPLGHPLVSVLGLEAVRSLNLSNRRVGVVVIGHGASSRQRHDLISHFRDSLSGVSILALLRRQEEACGSADFNCLADNPPKWIRTVRQTLAGIQ